MKNIFGTVLVYFITFSNFVIAQDDLMKMLDEEPKKKEYTTAAFKGTRLINMHTIETTGRRAMDFRISHRFGTFNSGSYQAFGIDLAANIRLSLEYSFDERFQFGLGRTSFQKIVDGFLKYRLLRQTSDSKTPISVTLLTTAFYSFEKKQIGGIDFYDGPIDRLSYAHQIIIGRKFSEGISFQIAPTLVHVNMVEKLDDKNDIYAICALGRVKISKRFAITAEYGYRLNKYSSQKYFDTFAVGCDIETGGHVFQLHFVNSIGLVESQFIPFTNTKWNNAGIRLGFNISRVFGV
jgi:hypothetical protein